MSTHIALLRGVNVGGARKLPMAELRRMVEDAGATDVRTYIQSGNVVFDHRRRGASLAAELSTRLEAFLGVDVDVVLRTPAQMDAVVDENPFPDADTSEIHVGFLGAAPSAGLRAFDDAPFEPERMRIVDHHVYLHLANGMGRARLPVALGRVKPPYVMTVRNWRTVLKLREMAADHPD